MFTFLSISSLVYLLYLYKYDKSKLNNLYKCLHNFSSNQNNDNGGNTENNEKNKNNENDDIEIEILDEYDMTDRPIEDPNNVKDYYDKSSSTDFVENLPILNRFYSFTKKNDDHNIQNV